MKKKLRIILFLSLLACLLCVSANAEEPEDAEQTLIIVEEDRSYPRLSAPAEPQGISVQALTQSSPETLAQAKQALTNLSHLLEAAGTSMANVVKTTVFIKEMNDFAAINEVYATFFEGAYPARSCVEVARLPKDVMLEIEAIAAK